MTFKRLKKRTIFLAVLIAIALPPIAFADQIRDYLVPRLLAMGKNATAITQYDYNGKTVYLVDLDPPCCDNFTAEVYDESMNYICAPSGGFTGRGDMQCKDFNEKAEKIDVIWKSVK